MILNAKGSHKKTDFFWSFPERGGRGLAESKISLTEKTEFFVGFFFAKRGGVSPIPRGFLS